MFQNGAVYRCKPAGGKPLTPKDLGLSRGVSLYRYRPRGFSTRDWFVFQKPI
jgi:hypothetical protein